MENEDFIRINISYENTFTKERCQVDYEFNAHEINQLARLFDVFEKYLLFAGYSKDSIENFLTRG